MPTSLAFANAHTFDLVRHSVGIVRWEWSVRSVGHRVNFGENAVFGRWKGRCRFVRNKVLNGVGFKGEKEDRQ